MSANNDEKEKKEEKEKSRRDALGKFLYNLAQTCFTAMVVGATVTFFITDVKIGVFIVLLLMGVASTVGLAYLANNILKK